MVTTSNAKTIQHVIHQSIKYYILHTMQNANFITQNEYFINALPLFNFYMF